MQRRMKRWKRKEDVMVENHMCKRRPEGGEKIKYRWNNGIYSIN